MSGAQYGNDDYEFDNIMDQEIPTEEHIGAFLCKVHRHSSHKQTSSSTVKATVNTKNKKF